MPRIVFVALLLLIVVPSALLGQSVEARIRQGNRAYKDKDYGKALLRYREAMTGEGGSKQAEFNSGCALYESQAYDSTASLYLSMATNPGVTADMRRDALYNAGNAFYKMEKYQESADAYREALRLSPGDREAQYNLSQALRKLKEQQQQQQKQQQNKDNKDQEKNQDKQDQDKGKDKEQENKDQNKDQSGQQNQQPDDGTGKPHEQPGSMTPEQAKRMLEAFRQQEAATHKKMQAEKAKKASAKKTGKAW